MSTILSAALLLTMQAAEPAPNMEALPPPPITMSPALPDPLPELTMEQDTALRCGVLFGFIAGGQDAGNEYALSFPPMEPRGKEFFVRTTAQLMEDERFTRAVVGEHVQRAMMELVRGVDGVEGARERVDELAPPCLLMLETSGL